MNAFTLSLAAFAAVSLGILGISGIVWDLFLRSKSRIDARMKEQFRNELREKVKQSGLFRDFAEVAAEITGNQPTWRMRLQTMLAQSGTDINPAQLWIATFVAAAAAAILEWFLFGGWLAMPLVALAGAFAPWLCIHAARKRRMARLCQQLPEAFTVMSRALSAGQAVPTAFQVVANDFPAPISEEFAYCFEQQHLGIPFEVSLRDLARRTGFVETQIFATALIINRQVGGNLAEVLNKLADTMRKRSKFKSRVRALTGEGRMQAVVLIALPIVALVALFVLNRSYAQALLDRPWLLAATFASQMVGAVCIRRITNFKF